MAAHAKGADAELEGAVWPNVRLTVKYTGRVALLGVLLWAASAALLPLILTKLHIDLAANLKDKSEYYQAVNDAAGEMLFTADEQASLFDPPEGKEERKCLNNKARGTFKPYGALVDGEYPTEYCQTTPLLGFKIMYVAKDGKSNIFTTKQLKQMQELEERITNLDKYTRYCLLHHGNYVPYPAASRSPGTTFESAYTEIVSKAVANPANRSVCTFQKQGFKLNDPLFFDRSAGVGTHMLSQDFVETVQGDNAEEVLQYWASPNRQSSFTIREPYSLLAVYTQSSQVNVPNYMGLVGDKDFKVGNPVVAAMASELSFGFPLDGKDEDDHEESQREEVVSWLFNDIAGIVSSAKIDGVDVLYMDDRNLMKEEEFNSLNQKSIMFIIGSVLFVMLFLVVMLDSIFLGVSGMLSIVLCHLPAFIVYAYIFQQEYIGFLNMIALFIILGIGVDDIFVFTESWEHAGAEPTHGARLQATMSHAVKAMATTSITTFVSFMANGGSAFPMISAFGYWSAALILVNFCMVTTWFPTLHTLYIKHFKGSKIDALPSTLKGLCFTPSDDDSDDGDHGKMSAGTKFFKESWAPNIIKLRYVIVVVFLGIFAGAIAIATKLEPDEKAPEGLKNNNQYIKADQAIRDHFIQPGSRSELVLTASIVSGIDPVTPIDRAGTKESDGFDNGKVVYAGCDMFNPSTPEAQVWHLNMCHDAFFGNVTFYHGGKSDFNSDGSNGPVERKVVKESADLTESMYYRSLRCPTQMIRDTLLSDSSCPVLKSLGVPCVNETMMRSNCKTPFEPGVTAENSCEPFPVPANKYPAVLAAVLTSQDLNLQYMSTNYDAMKDRVYIENATEATEGGFCWGGCAEPWYKLPLNRGKDFKCREYTTFDDRTAKAETFTLVGMNVKISLVQATAQKHKTGLKLLGKWEAWRDRVLAEAPAEMKATVLNGNGWAFYKLNDTLLSETFKGVRLSFILVFVILIVATANPWIALICIITIGFIVANVFAFTVLMGYKLGIVEAVVYTLVIGMSVDYSVHMADAYVEAHVTDRLGRVESMVETMAMSVLQGAFSTLGTVFWLFFAFITYYTKFADFLFFTVLVSCVYALVFLPALLAVAGPEGKQGNLIALFKAMAGRGDEDGAHVSGKAGALRV